jgi:membrane-bound lytic murein transglycosylase F
MKKSSTTIITALLSIVAFVACLLWSDGREYTVASDGSFRVVPKVHHDTIITQKEYPAFSISVYDDLFREYSDSLGWDWKWLAAVAYQESRFNADAVNPSGASGLMQLMPKTAEAMGVDSLHRTDPRASVRAASRLFERLNRRFNDVPMPDRVSFVLASYNAGHGHIQDAMRLTEKHGGMKNRWKGNVEYFLGKKSDPAFYKDSVCHYGRFSDGETIAFVKNVHDKYNEYSRLEALHRSVHKADTVLIPHKKTRHKHQ